MAEDFVRGRPSCRRKLDALADKVCLCRFQLFLKFRRDGILDFPDREAQHVLN